MSWSTSTRKARLPADWPTIRRRILERDKHTCRICGPFCIVWANEVDHIIAGDDHRESNLRASCNPCHARKSAAEGHAAKPKRNRPPEPHPGIVRE